MWLVHHLRESILNEDVWKGDTYLEAENGIQIAHSLRQHLPHVEEGILKKLLYRDIAPVAIFDEQFRSKGVSGPKTRPGVRYNLA
jgi:hypothetical protein